MPQDLIDGYGFSPLTDEVKRKILGLNAARLLGIDVEELRRQMAATSSPSRVACRALVRSTKGAQRAA